MGSGPSVARMIRATEGRSALLAILLGFVLTGCGDDASVRLGRPGGHFADFNADGAWCWFADPRALHFEGRRQRTYVGWVSGDGDIKVGWYDHDGDFVRTATVREDLQRDDHASPGLLMLPTGRLMVFYSAHSGKMMFSRVSRHPEDISSWGRERRIATNTRGRHGYTYPNPLLLRGEEDRIYLFWRGGNFKPTYSFSKDGTKWSRARTLIRGRGTRPYVKYVSDGDVTIHFAFTDGHPRRESTNSIYYAYYRSGDLHRADGLLIKSVRKLPLKPSEAERIYDGRRGNGRAWIWDIAIDMAGRPVIVYSVMPRFAEHHYRYARWTGSSWQDNEITSAGGWFPETPKGRRETEPHYSGGVILDHVDPSVVYLSRKVGDAFEIERWVTLDEGASWTSIAVTAGSGKLNVRPVVARGGTKDESVLLWMHGSYEHYTGYATSIKMARIETP